MCNRLFTAALYEWQTRKVGKIKYTASIQMTVLYLSLKLSQKPLQTILLNKKASGRTFVMLPFVCMCIHTYTCIFVNCARTHKRPITLCSQEGAEWLRNRNRMETFHSMVVLFELPVAGREHQYFLSHSSQPSM